MYGHSTRTNLAAVGSRHVTMNGGVRAVMIGQLLERVSIIVAPVTQNEVDFRSGV